MSKQAASGAAAAGTPGVCRCCLAVGRFRQLGRTYNWLGSTEHYATMLRTCFNIAIPHYDGADGTGKALICAVCVTQLRDAYNFKRQVELSQRRFEDVLQACDGKITINRMLAEQKGCQIKQEPAERPRTESEYLFWSEGEGQAAGKPDDVEFHCVEDQEPTGQVRHEAATPNEPADNPTANDYIIAIEVQEDLKTEQAAHFEIDMESLEAEPPDAEPPGAEPLDAEPPDARPPAARLHAGGARASRAPAKRKRSDDADYTPNKRKTLKKPSKIKPKETGSRGPKAVTKRSVRLAEEERLKRNASTIIANSQVCPFKCLHNVYRCFYCGVEYEDPAELRSHTALEHALDKRRAHRYVQGCAEVCVDITDMSCSVCEETFESLDDLIAHISDTHGKNIDSQRGTGVIPFKLTKDKLSCFVCQQTCYTFHKLSVHMNEHFSTFVCDVCGSTYATRTRLDRHMPRHDTGSFECAACDKVFSTRAKLKVHVECVHEKIKKLVCRNCDMRFSNYEQKVKHQVKVHNREPMQHKCQFCDNVYALRRLLMNHHRRDHLRVRNHRCEVCGKTFFLKSQCDNHRVTHTREKGFQCDVCKKKFNRKGNLVTHMATHTGLRSFACTICSCAFITSSHLLWHKKKLHSDNVLYF